MKGIKALEGLSFALKDKWQDKIVCKSENEKHTIAELLEIVYKDLEILDILKKYVYFSSKSNCVRMKDIYKRTTNFDYETLKEWLENE